MTGQPIRILWLETGDLYTVRQGIAAGERLGIDVQHLEVVDLEFVAADASAHIDGPAGRLTDSFDAVIVRSFMPWLSESLTIARAFAAAGKVVVDAALVDEGYGLSKMHDYMLLGQAGVPIPRTHQVFDAWSAEEAALRLGFPLVLKGIHGAEGRHVHKADSLEQFRKRLCQYKLGELLVQEYLPAEFDYRVMVVGFEALPVAVRRTPRPGDFRTNFEHQEVVVSVPTDEVRGLRDVAERAARVLRREFSGVDIRYRAEEPLVLEANRRPGFKAFETDTKYDVAGAFISYVASKVVAQRKG